MLSLKKSSVSKIERYNVKHDKYDKFYVLISERTSEEYGKTFCADLGNDVYGILLNIFAVTEEYCRDKKTFVNLVKNTLESTNIFEQYIENYTDWEEEE